MQEQAKYPKLCKRQHRVYTNILDQPVTQKLMLELANKERMAKGRLREISNETGICYKTLETWRCKLRIDPNYKPEHGHKGSPRKISQDKEDQIFDKLKHSFLEPNRYCPPRVIRAIAMNEVSNVQFGYDWVMGFMKRHNLSSRIPHIKRRTNPNDQHVSLFLSNMELVKLQFPDDLILNVDETSWRITNGRLHTVTIKGSDHVAVQMKEDPKKCLTVIACCTKSGERLPLWMIAKGKTEACEQRYRTDPRLVNYIRRKQLFIDHSENGWSTCQIMIRYLTWLKNYKNGYMVNVVWDLHASHRSEEVKAKASELEIGLTYIPAGQTDEWQPLDRRIFGILKARACSQFDAQMISQNLENFDIIDAISILLQCWSQITQAEISRSWENL